MAKKYLKKHPPVIKHFSKVCGDARVQSASATMTTEQDTPLSPTHMTTEQDTPLSPTHVRSVSFLHMAKPSCEDTRYSTNITKHNPDSTVTEATQETPISVLELSNTLTQEEPASPMHYSSSSPAPCASPMESIATMSRTQDIVVSAANPTPDTPPNTTRVSYNNMQGTSHFNTHKKYIQPSQELLNSTEITTPIIANACTNPKAFKIQRLVTPSSAIPSLIQPPDQSFLEVKRLMVDQSSKCNVVATRVCESVGKKITKKTFPNRRRAGGGTKVDNRRSALTGGEEHYNKSKSDDSQSDFSNCIIPTLPLLHGRTASPVPTGSLMVAGSVIRRTLTSTNDREDVTKWQSNDHLPTQLHKIDYNRSKNLYTAISNFERRQLNQLKPLSLDQKVKDTLTALVECKRQKELVRMHRAALRSELLGLAKSYSMYYSHLRLQDFQGRGYKPSLRMAWYSKYCNHVQMKEDFREDAQKVVEDWLLEKSLSLRQ